MLRINTEVARRLSKDMVGRTHWARRLRDQTQLPIYLIDLGDRLPAKDESGNLCEAYTSVFWIGHARCFSVTPRHEIERDGLEARLRQDESALASVGFELLD